MAQLRICFVGDSFVTGYGDPECLGWAGRICVAACREGHTITYYNLGIRRETTADIRARYEREIAPRLPSATDGRVVFSFGANDAVLENGQPRVPMEQSLENAREMLRTTARTYPVLMVGSPPLTDEARNADLARLVRAYAELCRELEIPLFDAHTPLDSSRVWKTEALANDGIHPGAGGYRELAELITGWSAWRSWLEDS